jgi:hypothetical protein
MNVITGEFKKAVRAVKAAGRGGAYDEQRVIVRAEPGTPGALVFVGIGTEAQPGVEASCRLKYDGDRAAVVTSLVGLRWLAGAVSDRDNLQVTVTEDKNITVVVEWGDQEPRATLRVRSESTLAKRSPK